MRVRVVLYYLLLGSWCAGCAGYYAAKERWVMCCVFAFLAVINGAGLNREFWR